MTQGTGVTNDHQVTLCPGAALMRHLSKLTLIVALVAVMNVAVAVAVALRLTTLR